MKKGKRLQFAEDDDENQEDVSPLVEEEKSQNVEKSSDKEKKNAKMCSCVNSWKTVAIAVIAFLLAIGVSAFISKFVGKRTFASVNSQSNQGCFFFIRGWEGARGRGTSSRDRGEAPLSYVCRVCGVAKGFYRLCSFMELKKRY